MLFAVRLLRRIRFKHTWFSSYGCDVMYMTLTIAHSYAKAGAQFRL